MACDFEPHEGSKPYLFISYSHKNKKDVFKILNRMNQDGYRIWYDEGIEWGTEWPTEIANHLVEAQAVLFFSF